MKAGVYLRVSTDRQDEANQEPDCLQQCAARGWEPVIYRERESAVKDRPEWARLKEAARRGEIRAVVFYSISRIGRRRVDIATDLADLSRYGMALVSVREKFLDVGAGDEGRRLRDLLIQLFGWLAESEREDQIDRTKKATDAIRRKLAATGVHVSSKGRTITRFGTPGLPEKWRQRAREMASAGSGPSAIRQQLRAEGLVKVSLQTIRNWTVPERAAARAAAAAAAGDPDPLRAAG